MKNRYLYKNSEGNLYSLDEYVPGTYSHENDYVYYLGCVDIHNEIELEDFLSKMSMPLEEYTEEDILKALRFEEYELISKKLQDFIHSTDSGTNETIEELVNEIIDDLGGDSYCSSVYDSLNECVLCNLHDFGNQLFYKTVEKIINVIKTFEKDIEDKQNGR